MPTDDSHPESSCARCAGPNVTWWAPSPLWNEVMRGGDINGSEEFSGIVCPTCFAVLAEERGIAEFWRLGAERVNVDLQTTTPSGRTWDAQTQLWQDPPATSPAAHLADEQALVVELRARLPALEGLETAARDLLLLKDGPRDNW